MAIDKLKTTSLEDNSVTSLKIAPGAVTVSDIGDSEISMAKLSQVNLAIAPETLEIQVAAPAAGQATTWLWTWEQSTLPYARRTITNSGELNVPLYKEGTYVVNNFAAYDLFGAMTQTHSLYLKWIDGAGTDNLVSWATSTGPISDTHPDINGGNATDVQRISVSVPATITPPSLTAPTVAYTVVNSGSGSYTFSGAAKGDNPNLGPLYKGGTYTFAVSATGHPFYLTTDNGTNFSAGTYFGEYTSGVTGSRTDSGTITFTVPADAPDTLYYQCGNHSAMRGAITVKSLAVETNINGNYVVYFQHTQEGHKTPVELRPIPSLVNQMCLVYDGTSGKFVPQDLSTYVENTPSFENKIREVAGTAELVVADGSAVIAKVNVYADSTYLPLTGNNAGDQAFATDNNTLYIWDGSQWETTQQRTTSTLTEGTNLYYTDARADARISAATTTDLTEGTNLYYTDARADARISAATTTDLTEGTNLYYTDARADARAALLVDSAPGTLDTLNELAAALGDDPNFATTVTNSIADKLPLSGGALTGTLIVNAGDNGLDIRVGTDKRILFAGNIGEIGSVAGFQAVNTAGNANTAFGIRATDIRFATGADERVRITDTGVGIGTTSPGAKLHVQTSHTQTDVTGANSNSTLNIANSGAGNGIYNAIKFAANQQDMYIMSFNNNQQADRRLGFFLGSVAGDATTDERLSILGNGNVGIGTASPTEKLHVVGDVSIGTGGTGGTASLKFVNDNERSRITSNYDAGGGGRLGFWTDTTGGTLIQRLTIKNSGNVGIGTTSPVAKLHVYNENGGNATDKATMLSEAVLKLQPHTANSTNLLVAQVNNGNGIGLQVTNGPATANWDLALSPFGGNVGIGTTSPTYKLQVEGGNVSFNNGSADTILNLETDTSGTYDVRFNMGSGQNDISDEGHQIWYNNSTGDTHFNNTWTGGKIRFHTATQTDKVAPGTNERMTIDENGNVGIGVTSPRNKLSLGNPHESPANTDRILNWYDAGSELHNGNIYQAIVMDSNNTSQPGQIGIALANKNMQVGSWSPAITFGGRSQAGSGDYMNGGAAIASKNFTGTNDGNFIDSELHFFTKGSHTSAERNLSSKLKITGQGTVSITNGDLGHTHFTDKQGRYLTSNGAGWTSGVDGTDPGLVVSQYHTGTEVKNLGIVLHNDTSTQSAKSPTISFGAVSASSAYNTTYAHIVGNRRGTGADTNWASGDLEFHTTPDQGYAIMPNMTVHHGGQVSGSMNGRTFGISNNNWLTFGTLYGAQSSPLHIKVLVGHNSSGGYGEFTNDTYAYNVAAGTVVTIGNTSGSYTAQLRKIKRVGGVGFSSGDGGWEYQIARNQGYSFGVHMQVMGATSGWRWQV